MRPATALRSPRSTASVHRAAAAAVAALALLGAVVLPAPAARATAYRFWSYWVGADGPWSFSAQGAARVPQDGDVDGWRFAVSPATGSSTPPRQVSDFESICADTAAAEGKKRVGVVIDFGTGADAPPGQSPPAGPVVGCVVVDSDANGYAVLDAVTSLRVDAGLVCGIAGYPATGCGEPVSDDDGSDAGPGDDQGDGAPSDPDPGPDQGDSPAPEAAARPAGSGSADPDQRTGSRGPGDGGASDPTSSEPVAVPSPVATVLAAPPTGAGGDGGAPLGLLAGLLVVLGLGVAAAVVSRSRS